MEQHPVPQPITSYEFRLVGDMTIKQFGKLAAGIIAALIVYGINPPGFIKWPLILLFAGIGFSMAFVPFEGRPIDIWIIAFFKRIYSPTQYIWKKKDSIPAKTVAATPQPTISTAFPTQPSPPPPPPPPTAPPPVATSLPASKPATASPPLTGSKFHLPPIPPPGPMAKAGRKIEPKFIPNTIIPTTPTLPNLIVGSIKSKQGKIIEGAILEIRDSLGNPVRAFKTNKLGQFLSATPLLNGEYEIETEKEGYQFDIIKVNLEGKILPPIEITSK